MGKDSKIQWCDHTWNPFQGCRKVSAGCANCYMYRDKKRYGQDPTTVVRSKPATFNAPLKWKKPARVFVCSWSDFFIEEADEWRDDAYEIMAKTPHLTYMLLTKRIERVVSCLPADWPLNNVWLGVSVENQSVAHDRISSLLQIECEIRLLSIEPLLGPLDISPYLRYNNPINGHGGKDGEYQEERRGGSQSSSARGTGDRSTGKSVAYSSEALEPLEEKDNCHSLQEKAGRAQCGRIFTGTSDVSRAQISCTGSPPSILPLQGCDSRESNDQSSGRQQDKQSPKEFRNNDLLRANQTRIVSSEGRSDESMGGKECNVKTNSDGGEGDSQTQGVRRKVEKHSSRLSRNISNSIQNCQGRPALSWVICGGESGPNARPMAAYWARDIRDQCQAAGVAFFMKQMSKKAPIPDDLMIREFPGG